MNIHELWHLSSVVLDEIYFQTQLNSAGGQKNKLLERYEKNLSSMKSMNIINMIVVSLFLLSLAIMPISTFSNLVNTEITSNNIHNLLFITSFSLSTYYIMSFIIILVFGLMQLVELMDGTAFNVLIPLPLPKRNLQWLGILVFIKMHYFQIIVLIFTLPVGVLLITRSILLGATLFICNIMNIAFSFYTIVIIANFIGKKIFKSKNPSKLRTVARIIAIFVYMIIIFNIYSLFGSFSILSQGLFNLDVLSETNGKFYNSLLSLIFFPLSGSYIVILTIMPFQLIPIELIITSILGFSCLLGITLLIMSKGNKILQKLGYPTEEDILSDKTQNEAPVNVKIKINDPVISIIRTTLMIASRNYASLFVLLAPVVFTLISFSFTLSGYEESIDPFIFLFFYAGIIPTVLKNGIFGTEENIGSLLTSLPLKQIDVFRSKQMIMIFFANVNVAIIFAFQLITSRQLYITSGVLVFFANIIAPTTYLLLYAYFFGKLNYGYSLYTVNLEKSVLKNILLFILPTLNVMLSLILTLFISLKSPIDGIVPLSSLILVNVIIILILELITRKIF